MPLPSHIKKYLVLSYVSQAFTFAVPLLSALLASKDDLSSSQVALLLMVIYATVGVLQFFVGKFFDQGKYLFSLYASFVGVLLGLSIFIVAFDQLLWFIFGTTILLLGIGILATAITRAIEGSVPLTFRGRVATVKYLVQNIGFCTAAIIGFFFLQEHRTLLLSLDLLTTLSVIVFLLVLFKTMLRVENLPSTRRTLAFSEIWSLFRARWRVFLGAQLIFIEIFSHSEVQPILYDRLGLETIRWTTFMFVCNTATVVLVTSLITKYGKGKNIKAISFIGALFYGIGHGMVPYFLQPWGIAMTTVISVLGEIFWVAPLATIVYMQFKDDDVGMASGIRMTIRSFAFVFNPIIAFILFRYIPDVRLGFALIYGLIPLLGFWLIFSSPYVENIELQ
ncbi:MAG: MFS transporter [Bdellovibrionota bacterium]